MRTWIALLVVLAAIAAALVFGLGLLDGDTPDDRDEPAEPPVADGTDPAEEPGEEDPLLRAGQSEPEKAPALEEARVREPLGVLLLAGVPQRFNLFLAQHLDSHPDVTVHSWAPKQPEGVPPPSRLPGALPGPPRGTSLDDLEIDVVVVHDLDPALLERDFWLEVTDRLAEGRLGLLVMPSLRSGPGLLDHDVLATVLPVAKATPIEGQPVPGTIQGLAPYAPTDAGIRHPASRLVGWPGWSKRIWGSKALLETPWGTNVCYPVEEVAPGASVLLEVRPEGGDAMSALIAGAPAQGRVLWFGGWDLGGRHAYGRGSIVSDWRTLIRNWATWLAGQVED